MVIASFPLESLCCPATFISFLISKDFRHRTPGLDSRRHTIRDYSVTGKFSHTTCMGSKQGQMLVTRISAQTY